MNNVYFELLGLIAALFLILVFIQVQTDQEAALISSQCSTIVALTKGCKSAKVVRDQTDIPDGCGSAVVTPTLFVHTLVRVRLFILVLFIISKDLKKLNASFQGLVDLEKEINKCEKKLDLARLNLQKIVKIESQPEYEDTVPANVRTANDEKV